MELSPELLLLAYESGYFPMAAARADPTLHWLHPDPRAILPLDAIHIPTRLRKTARARPYRIVINRDFSGLMAACATPRQPGGESWINPTLLRVYRELHELGYAHSIECRDRENPEGPEGLAGGLYGVSLGGAFFGESMVALRRDASKIALIYLLEILRRCGYQLLDTQFTTAHLQRFGVCEISRPDYQARLARALMASPNPSRRFADCGHAIASEDPRTFTVMAPSASRLSV